MSDDISSTIDIGRGESLALPIRTNLLGGLSIQRKFSKPDIHPYDDGVVWTRGRVEVMDYAKGKPSYLRENVEVPSHWAPNAIRITVSKYLFGHTPGTPEFEDSLRHAFDRIANTYTVWGWRHGYFAEESDAVSFNWEIKAMLVRQIWAPNSPVWFNVGHWEQWRWGRPDLRELLSGRGNKSYKATVVDGKVTPVEFDNVYIHPQCSACFLTEIEDSMEAIFAHVVTEGRVFASGSGIGLNISTLRSSQEPISGKGKSSGGISFDKGFDRMAYAIKSGGKTRRAARMVLMDSNHPDVFEFINTKAEQERIAKVILREHNTHVALVHLAREKSISGNVAEMMAAAIILALPLVTEEVYDDGMDSLVYGETIGHQNANHSVSLLADFWEAFHAGGTTSTRWVTKPDVIADTFRAEELLRAMANACWENAEPGCHNNDWINIWSPYKEIVRLNTSNPCLPGDVLVAGKGLFSIEKLVGLPTDVVCGDDVIRPFAGAFPTGVKPVFRLRTELGYSIDATDGHRFSIMEGEDRTLAEIRDGLPDKPATVLLKGAAFGDVEVDPTIAYLAGRAVINGGVSPDGSLLVNFHNEEGDLINELRERVSSFDTEAAVLTPTGNSAMFCQSDLIVQQLAALIDCTPFTAHIKDAAFALSKDATAAFVRGIIEGGVESYDCGLTIGSDSFRLVSQIQILLLSFGIKARQLGKDPDSDLYSIEIVPGWLTRVSNAFGVAPRIIESCQTEDFGESEIDETMADRVVSVTALGELPVFDLSEPMTSHFVANGIVVHNCSEYLAVNNTSCNLSSFNIFRFFDWTNKRIDAELLDHGIGLAMLIADLNIEEGGFPIPEIAVGTYTYRTTGIGYGNLGGLIMALGLPYDSNEARFLASQLFSFLTSSCWRASAKMGGALGGFHIQERVLPELRKVIALHTASQRLSAAVPGVADGSRDAAEVVESSLLGLETPVFESVTAKRVLNAQLRAFDFAGPMSGVGYETALLLARDATSMWEELAHRKVYRNSFVSCTAPGGTISAPLGIYDEGTTSAEPDYTLVKYKALSGGGTLRMFNTLALTAMRTLGYSEGLIREAALEVAGVGALIDASGSAAAAAQHLMNPWPVGDGASGAVRQAFEREASGRERSLFIEDLLSKALRGDMSGVDEILFKGKGHIEGFPWLLEKHLPVFDCADTSGDGKRSIAARGHMRMLAAIQPFISGATSKTVNLPYSATRDEIFNCFVDAHEMGIKCIALYRADSKGVSVYQTKSPERMKWDINLVWAKLVNSCQDELARIQDEAAKPFRRKLPGLREARVVKFDIGGQLDGFLIVGVYPDGTCGEVFGRLGQGGSFAHGMFESFCKAFSAMLQWGVPVDRAIKSFKGTAFDPAGFVKVGESDSKTEIRSCKSAVDLMMQILAWMFPASNNYVVRDIVGRETRQEFGDVVVDVEAALASTAMDGPVVADLSSAAMCPECHALAMIADGKCLRCVQCGYSGGGCGG